MRTPRIGTLPVLLFSLASTPTVCLAQFGPVSVTVAPVERRTAELTQPLVASVEPVTRSTLAAEEAGLIAERMFDEGQALEKGAVLARLKTDLLESQLAAAEAARSSAEAYVVWADAEVMDAAQELQRVRQLVGTNAARGREVREAETAAKVKAAGLQVRQADLDEKAAEVTRLKLLIEKAEVKSPIAGVVSRRYVEVGQWIKQGDPVADIVQLDPLFVRVNVPEAVMPRLRPGDEAVVTVDALRGQRFVGKVDQLLPEADPGSRTFAVKILLPNPDRRVWPGFFARATLVSKSEVLLLVPKDAVVDRGGAAHVVAARGGKAVIVPVKRGPAQGDRTAVSGELTEKDRVVTRGNEQLRGGEPLLIAGDPPAAAPAASAGG